MSYEWMAETSARHWDFVIQEIHTHLAAHYIFQSMCSKRNRQKSR